MSIESDNPSAMRSALIFYAPYPFLFMWLDALMYPSHSSDGAAAFVVTFIVVAAVSLPVCVLAGFSIYRMRLLTQLRFLHPMVKFLAFGPVVGALYCGIAGPLVFSGSQFFNQLIVLSCTTGAISGTLTYLFGSKKSDAQTL